jgi:hypothetical protein
MTFSRTHAMRKLRGWLKRYLPAEICGTVTALAGFWVVYKISGSLAAAALAGSICEAVGFYGIFSVRETLIYWHKHAHHTPLKRLWTTGWHTTRDMLLEFGPAEAVDSLFIRPLLFYVLPATFSNQVGAALLVAKIIADVFFYGIAIVCYEARRRFVKDSVSETAH